MGGGEDFYGKKIGGKKSELLQEGAEEAEKTTEAQRHKEKGPTLIERKRGDRGHRVGKPRNVEPLTPTHRERVITNWRRTTKRWRKKDGAISICGKAELRLPFGFRLNCLYAEYRKWGG